MNNIEERVYVEVLKGFKDTEEMNAIFNTIAEEFNVGSNVVWKAYYDMKKFIMGKENV